MADYSAELMDYQEALSTIQIRDDNKITCNPTTISLDLGFIRSSNNIQLHLEEEEPDLESSRSELDAEPDRIHPFS